MNPDIAGPDVLDELQEKIAGICETVERECDRLLDAMVDRILERPGYNWLGPERAEVSQLALAYAQWAHMLEGYRGMLRVGSPPVTRVK